MAAINLSGRLMVTTVLESVQSVLPQVRFRSGEVFCWSPKQQRISYISEALQQDTGIWALLHEAGHALAGHTNYSTDFELLTLEVEAWEKARLLGKELGISIDKDHIEDCLDTYRDWLHRRSLCPTCGSVSLQHSITLYACHNCPARWQVTAARFCRPYRKITTSSQPLETSSSKQTVSFH